MSTSKKTNEQRITAKRQELVKLEERMSKDSEKRRQLKAEISELEAAELQLAIREAGLTFEEAKALLAVKGLG